MGRTGHPFMEVFASTAGEEYRFPVLEVFAGLFALGTFVLAGLFVSTGHFTGTEEGAAFALVNSLTGMPIFVLVVLMLKNVAYGLGNDLERSVLQTYLSYPIKRRSLLSGRLISSIGIPLVLFLGMQLFALFMISPDLLSSHPNVVVLTYTATLCYPLLIISITLALTMFLKKGGLALIVGVILYFGSGVASNLLGFLGVAVDSALPLKVFAVVRPDVTLHLHYAIGMFAEEFWVPSIGEVVLYIVAGYCVVALIFIAAYLYFERRLET